MHQRYSSEHCFVWAAGLIDVFLFGLAGRVTELCICLGLLGYTLVRVCCLGALCTVDEFCFWMFYVQFMDSVFLLLFCLLFFGFAICVCRIIGLIELKLYVSVYNWKREYLYG